MDSGKRILGLALICACALVTPEQLIAGPKPQPVWTVDLKKYGFRGLRFGVVDDAGSMAQIAFSKNTVAVLFDEKAEELPQKGTDGKTWERWHFVGLFFDAKTGNLLAKRSWIADLPWPVQVFPTAAGNFVFLMSRIREPLEIPSNSKDLAGIYDRHPTTLLLLSPTGEELRRVELPLRGTSKDEYWKGQVSPSGTSILVTHVGNNFCEFVLLDANTLTQRSAGKQSDAANCAVAAISDEQVLFHAGKEQSLIGKFGSSLNSISLPYGHSRFLKNDLIVTFSILPWGAAMITRSTGEQVAAFRLDIHDPGPRGVRPGVMPPFASSDGRRFGTVIDQAAGSLLFRKEERTLYVWQEPGNKLMFTAQLKYSIIQGAEGMLSDDGSHLAVLNARRVSMYDLPTP